MFVATDVTHTGHIDYTEFIAATIAAQQTITEPTVRRRRRAREARGEERSGEAGRARAAATRAARSTHRPFPCARRCAPPSRCSTSTATG